jgi:hypothetical protein
MVRRGSGVAEKPEGRMAWLAKYGVPSLLLSVAVFVFQQQQQTFDRVQRITADGWQFYSNGRTELQYFGDVEDELALLKVIGYAFPNIFCDVRRDIYERAWSAEPPEPVLVAAPAGASGVTTATLTSLAAKAPDGRRYIQQSQLDGLRVALEARGRSNRPDQPGNLIEAWFPAKDSKPCPALDNSTGAAPAPVPPPTTDGGRSAGAATPPRDTKDVKPADAAPAAPPPPAPAAAEAAAAAAAEAAKQEERVASSGAASGPARSSGPADPVPVPPPVVASAPAPSIALPDMKQASREVQIFFHIRDTGARDRNVAEIAENSRLVLSAYNFRVIRKVARIGADQGFPAEPQIRFFGPQQRRDAEQLAEYLTLQFRAEGLRFKLSEIGGQFPNMNPQNIEVWVPDPR